VVVISNAIERLQHDDGVAADHTHSNSDFFSVGARFGSFVEDDIEEDLWRTISYPEL
jgi:hypothetical protein